MNTSKVTPKDFFLWAGAVIALYVAVFNYIALVWNYVDYAMPDPLDYYPSDPYQSGISWEMAALIVLTPAFLALMYLIRRDMRKDQSRKEIWVRRWALYLTVFVAGAAIVGDLIFVLYTFLNGEEITTRFILKALVVLLVAAVGLMHFLADIWNYWSEYPERNRYVSVATLLLVFCTVIAGFFIVGSPAQARLQRLDDQKLNDLVSIQSMIVNYWQSKERMPSLLSDLHDPISGTIVPRDPQTGESYEYSAKGSMIFELCAVFNAEGQLNSYMGARPVSAPMIEGKAASLENDVWHHAAGRVCFERTIDPERYPPYSKMKNL